MNSVAPNSTSTASISHDEESIPNRRINEFEYLGNTLSRITKNVKFSLRKLHEIQGSRTGSLNVLIQLQNPNNRILQQIKSPHASTTNFHAKEVLETLSTNAPEIATNLGLKADALPKVPFRLGKPCQPGCYPKPATKHDDQTYIALSYCWRAAREGSLHDGNDTSTISQGSSLPISHFMFNAVLAKRASPSEGIWIDQLCVNQDDEEEKMTTIGLMDVIYKNARLVVILPEDVIMSET
jgi:Heterokaryon incompatibility protein (HET)